MDSSYNHNNHINNYSNGVFHRRLSKMKKAIPVLILVILFSVSLCAATIDEFIETPFNVSIRTGTITKTNTSEWDLEFYIVEPNEYSIYTSNSVLFNITANFTASTVNVSLYTKTNKSEPYTRNVSGWVLVNGSYVNGTVIFADEERVWWYLSFEDNQSRVIKNTSIRIFDVDVNYNNNCAALITEGHVFDIQFRFGLYLQNIHTMLKWKGIDFVESDPIEHYEIDIYPCNR